MSKIPRLLIAVALMSLVGVCGFFVFKNKLTQPIAAVNEPTAQPNSNLLVDAKAQDILQEIKQHKWTLINIWATWCDPCKEEFPVLLNLRKKYLPEDLNVIFVSADFATQKNEALEFLTAQKVDFKTYHKNEDDTQFINTFYPQWSGAIPATLIFNQAGALLKHWQGGATAEQFEAAIQEILRPSATHETEVRDD